MTATTHQHLARSAPAPARALLWGPAGLALIGFAIFEIVKHDVGAAPLLGAAILPDLAFIVGIGQPHEKGQLPRRTVPVYNALHAPLLPLVLLVAVVAIPLDVAWWVVGLGWLAHIAIDRAVGYGPRTPDGWQRG